MVNKDFPYSISDVEEAFRVIQTYVLYYGIKDFHLFRADFECLKKRVLPRKFQLNDEVTFVGREKGIIVRYIDTGNDPGFEYLVLTEHGEKYTFKENELTPAKNDNV